MDFPVNEVRNGPTFSEKIDRHEWSQLGRQRYVREYVDPLKPVIITGALEHWPARSKWTFDFFQDHYGHLPLEVDGRQLSMAQLIAEVVASTPHAPAPYLRNYLVKLLAGSAAGRYCADAILHGAELAGPSAHEHALVLDLH